MSRKFGMYDARTDELVSTHDTNLAALSAMESFSGSAYVKVVPAWELATLYAVVDRQSGEVADNGFRTLVEAEACRDDFNCVETADSNRFYVREPL